MKFLKSYTLYERVSKETKLFESGRLVTFAMAKRMRKIKSTITDILRDNVLDKDIALKIHDRNYTNMSGDKYYEVIKIQIGDEFLDIDNLIKVDEIKDDIYAITSYLEDEGYQYNTYSYECDGEIKGDSGDVMMSIGLETTYLSLFYKKEIKDPHLESFISINESNDNDITFVKNILLDMSDDDISIKVSDLKEYSPNSPTKKISILIGDDEDELSEIFFDVSKYIETLESINNYLTGEGYSLEFSHFLYFDENGMVTNSFHSSNFDEIKDKLKNITQLKICEIIYKDIELKETIKVPIEIGDTVLGGRFKNKKIVVKKIGKNKKGDITINDKPLLKFRLVKENLQEDVDYYFRHLEDDNFVIQTENDYFRIFKPKNGFYGNSAQSVYSYSNCNTFQWSEIAGEISRYVIELDDSENSEKSIEYAYIVKREDDGFYAVASNRKQIHPQMLLDDTFDAGEILSFTIGFK